jgi:aarF domain-containing kinase
LKTFYKMIIYDNFIHADCHAGNIFIRITPRRLAYDKMSVLEQWRYKLENFQDRVYSLIEEGIEYGLNRWAEYQID